MNWDEIIIVAGQGLVFLTALAGCIQSIRNRHAIQEVHLIVNSRLTEFKATADKLAEIASVAAHARGVLQGRAEVQTDGRATDSTT